MNSGILWRWRAPTRQAAQPARRSGRPESEHSRGVLGGGGENVAVEPPRSAFRHPRRTDAWWRCGVRSRSCLALNLQLYPDRTDILHEMPRLARGHHIGSIYVDLDVVD